VPSSTAVDVAIGLAFVYFILSLVCSIANETLASALGWRSEFLRKGLANLLVNTSIPDAKARTDQVETDLEKLFDSPLIAPMIRHDAGLRKAKKRHPSYLPARTFVAAVLEGARATAGAKAEIGHLIEHVPDGRVKGAFAEIYRRADGDAQRFQALAEEWYDDTMERVSGWYKRRSHVAIWVLGLALAIALNADTIRIGSSLWTDEAVRNAVVKQAQLAQPGQSDANRFQAVAREVGELDKLKVPMGWTHANAPHSFWSAAAKVLGLLLTSAALSLGAPFWFDLLSKVARVRASGAPPPATRAVRHGEGEETRAGHGVQ
jgi:hypothetical protein